MPWQSGQLRSLWRCRSHRGLDVTCPRDNRAVTTALLPAFMIIGVAAAAQAITGFGFALLAVPLLALVMHVDTAVVGGSLASLALTAGTAVRERHHVRWRTTVMVSGVAILGLPLGLFILEVFTDRALGALVGVAVLVSTLIVWRRPRLGGGWPTLTGVGLLVGVLTTATGTNGPPLVAAFQSMGYPPRAFRATIAAIFTVCGVASVAFFVAGREVTAPVVAVTLIGLPSAAIGWWTGDRLFHRIDAVRFRRVVLIALVIASMVTLARAVVR